MKNIFESNHNRYFFQIKKHQTSKRLNWNVLTSVSSEIWPQKTNLITEYPGVSANRNQAGSVLVWYRPVTSRRRAGKPYCYVLVFRHQVKYFISSVIILLRDWISMLSFAKKNMLRSVTSEPTNFVKEKTHRSLWAQGSCPAGNWFKIKGLLFRQSSLMISSVLIPSQQDQINKPVSPFEYNFICYSLFIVQLFSAKLC